MTLTLWCVCAGLASAIYAVVSLFRGKFGEFLLALIFSGLLIGVGYMRLTEKSPAQQQAAEAYERKQRAMDDFRAEQRRGRELQPHVDDLDALGRDVAAFVKAKMDSQKASAGHDLSPTAYIQHPMHSAFDGVVIMSVSHWRTNLAGQVVVFCKFTPQRGWEVEGVKAKDFRNSTGGLDYSPAMLANMSEMYELAVGMYQKQTARR